MAGDLSIKNDRLWMYTILPIVVLLLVSFGTYGVYYALQAVRPEAVADFPIGQVVFIQYLFIAAFEWVLAVSIIRRLNGVGDSVIELIASDGRLWQFRLLPALLMFLGFNLSMAGMMVVLYQTAQGSSLYAGMSPWQEAFLMVLILASAPFCEELIWRGYVITRLEARGRRVPIVILLSALTFALIHGDPVHWFFTFLTGLIAAWYYVRERNLIPLMIAHAFVDLWSFGWVFFLS